MHSHERLLRDFYAAFGRCDAEQMVRCYHPLAVFQDPIFGTLTTQETGAMWRMLLARAQNLSVEILTVTADDQRGAVRWIAHYDFSKTGRRVHNSISTHVQFADGRIVQHDDRFDLWRWARMALGAKGVLLGGTPLFKKALQRQSKVALHAWMQQSEQQ